MIYLGLAIISSMLVSVLMRASERHGGGAGMLTANYLMCCLLAGWFTGWNRLLPADVGLPVTLALGALNGALYLGGFVLLKWNIGRNGVVLPATFMKLGVIIPTLLGIAVFGETPGITQLLGILAAIAAILIMQGGKTGRDGDFSLPGLILLMVCGGGADAMSKVFESLGPSGLEEQFLLYTFIVALGLCILMCIVQRQRISAMEILLGMLIGIPNYLSSRFLLLSLADLPAMVAFPSYSVGAILLVAVVGAIVFRERFSRRKIIGLGIILAALVLLNL